PPGPNGSNSNTEAEASTSILLRVVDLARGGVVVGEAGVGVKQPRSGVSGRGCGGQGAVVVVRVSVCSGMADRALVSSMRCLLVAQVAMSADMASRLVVRGLPRLVLWMRVMASSVKRGSVRPAILRWWWM